MHCHEKVTTTKRLQYELEIVLTLKISLDLRNK